MAKNQSTYTLKIDAELSNLQKTLNEAKISLAGLLGSGKAPKGLEKAFEKINDLIGQISDKAGRPLNMKELLNAGKNLDDVQDSFRSIIRLLGDFHELSDELKIKFLSKEDQAQIEATTNALKKYQTTLITIAEKEKELAAARKVADKDEEKVRRVSGKVTDISGRKSKIEASKEAKKGTLLAMEGLGEKADPVKIAKLRGEIGELDAEINNLAKSLVDVESELTRAQVAFSGSSSSVAILEKEIKRINSGSLKSMKAEAEGLGISLEGLNGRDAASQMEILGRRLEEFKNQVSNSGSQTFKEIKEGCQEGADAAKRMGQDIGIAVESVEQMDEAASQREAFEGKIKQFLGLSGAAHVLRSALRDAIATITELDATMTEMAVVTDLTVGDYWGQLPEYSQRASELGVSINSAYKAATLYYQQGLKTNEVNAISTETLKMAKVAGLEAAEATDKMTAALRGFNMELNEASAQRVADVYSELAAITAADVNEISTAMTKTASIASSAGMEFETTAAFLSQIIETTRESAETAGTALKTVIARFQELKKDPSEIGEVEGEIVDANAIEKALRSVGVSLRDTSGQFRELDEVFLELSSKWDGLDKNTQRYIATIAAGSRQQSRFIAMMSDYSRTQELVASANTSAGASNKQFEKTMDSLEAKVEKLKNAWHEFTMGIMNSDLVKFGVDVLTKFLEIINKATSGIDGLGGSVTKILGILTVFKVGSTIFEKLKQPLINFFAEIVKEAGIAGAQAAEAAKEGAEKIAKAEKEKNKAKTRDTKAQGNINKITSGIKTLGKNKKKRTAEIAQSELDSAQERMYEDPEGWNKAVEKAAKTQQDLTDELYDTEQAWKDISEGISGAGKAVIGFGMGLSAIGGILSSIGLESFGNGLAKVGNYAAVAGSSITALATIVPLLGKTFTIAGKEISIAGWIASSGWIWLLGISAAIVAITLIVTAIKKASPEEKLKKAQQAADEAANSANNAKESFEGLADSLEQLDDKYQALENIIKGTKEWGEAIKDINTSVLDLIGQYPELAKFVENRQGTLTIDVNSQEVQDILNRYEQKSLIAQSNALAAKTNVLAIQEEVAFKKLGDKAVSLGDSPVSDNLTTKERTDNVAKALAEGIIRREDDTFKVINGYEDKLLELGWTVEDLDNFNVTVYAAEEELKKYGETLIALNEQQQAYYDTLATQALSMVDLPNKTVQTADQISNLLTGEDYKREVDSLKNDYFKRNGAINRQKADEELEAFMLKQDYVSNVKRVGANQIVYYDKEGKRQTANKETILNQMINEEAAINISNRVENVAPAIDEITKQVISQMGVESGIADAVNRLFEDETGGALLNADYKALKGLSEDAAKLGDIFESLNEEEKKLFGEKEAFVAYFQDAVNNAGDAFDNKAKDAADYMSAGMAITFQKKLDEVGSFAGGEEKKAQVKNVTANLLQGIADDDTKREIQDLINRTDWTNLEELLALQIELEQQYGYSYETAQNYIQVLGDAAYATSGLSTTVKTFGKLWKATEKINQSLSRLTQLEWEYERALEGRDGEIQNLVPKMLNEYDLQAAEYQKAYEASNDDIAKIYAQGGLDYKIDLRKFVELSEYGIKVDESRLQDAIDSKDITSDDANKWLEQLNNQYSTSQEQLEGLRNTLDKIEELESRGSDAYYELRSLAKEAILDSLQKQIDIQQETLDATKDANNQLINKIQESIDDSRQARQNEKAQKDIASMQSRQAYLAMDTSGVNSLQLQELDKKITEAEQDYADSLVDQTIQNLQDSNEKAAEQRERQIQIAEMALGEYEKSAEFQQDVNSALQEMLAGGVEWENSSLGQLLIDKFTNGLSLEEKGEWISKIGDSIDLANTWKSTDWENYKSSIETKIDGITSAIKELPGQLTTTSEGYKLQDQKTELKRAGFSESDINNLNEQQLNQLSSFTAAQTSSAKTASYQKALEGKEYDDLSTWISKQSIGDILSGDSGSYEDYLEGIVSNETAAKPITIDSENFVPLGTRKISGKSNPDKEGLDYTDEHTTDTTKVYVDGVGYEAEFRNGGEGVSDEIKKKLNEAFPEGPSDLQLAEYKGQIYLYRKATDSWNELKGSETFKEAQLNKLRGYQTGGLADFTGPAWLDGTPSKPEYVLSSKQTEKFFSLIDVLESYDVNQKGVKSAGDNYFDISINIEKIEDDYDIEQIADKIRRMICDDATYRNVNSINHIR